MKAYFINPPNDPFTSGSILIEPVDLLTLASMAKSEGFEAVVVDMDASKMGAGDLEFEPGSIVAAVFDFFIPLHGEGARRSLGGIFAAAKARGCATMLCSKLGAAAAQGADVCLGSEAFEKLPEALHCLAQKLGAGLPAAAAGGGVPEGKAFVSRIPDRSLADLSLYIDVRTVLTSVGCHLKCKFCHVPGFWSKWKAKAPETVLEEICRVLDETGARKILFLDDNAWSDALRMEKICAGLAGMDTGCSFGCLASVDRLSEERVAMMAKAGFKWVHAGAETADRDLLASCGKKHAPEDLARLALWCRNCGLRLRTSWIVDLPGATPANLLQAEEMIRQVGSDEIRLHCLSLRRGSILSKELGGSFSAQGGYIHSGAQNLNLTLASEEEVAASHARIVAAAKEDGYLFAQSPEFFGRYGQELPGHKTEKIISVCPMRYGIGWGRA